MSIMVMMTMMMMMMMMMQMLMACMLFMFIGMVAKWASLPPPHHHPPNQERRKPAKTCQNPIVLQARVRLHPKSADEILMGP